MLLGDIGETLKLAAASKLAAAKMRLFHPLGFMLASPAASADEALSYFESALVEDKYDGIRAQAHCSGGEVRIFSRTRDEITESFPELPDALAGLPDDVILDGEIVAWIYETPDNLTPASRQLSGGRPARRAQSDAESPAREIGRALPFSALQQRLGRKQVSENLMEQVPVAYLVFDVLFAKGELLLERSLLEREKILDALLATPEKLGHEPPSVNRRVMMTPVPHTQVILRACISSVNAAGTGSVVRSRKLKTRSMIKINVALHPGRRGKRLGSSRELATPTVVTRPRKRNGVFRRARWRKAGQHRQGLFRLRTLRSRDDQVVPGTHHRSGGPADGRAKIVLEVFTV
jgi:DNA ligase-1